MRTGCKPSAAMSWYIWERLRLSLISNCSSPASSASFPWYLLSWSPMPVLTPADTLVAAMRTMPLRKAASSREETVMPTKGKKMR